MSNDGMRKPGNGLDGAEIASTSVAVPLDGATQAQIDKGREIAQALSRDDLTIYVATQGGELKELPIGDAIGVLNARKEITDVMAISLKALYETTLARLGKTEDEVRQTCEDPTKQRPEIAEQITTYRSVLEAIQEAARETLPNSTTGKQEKNPFYGDFTYSVDLGDGLTEVSILEAITWLGHKGKLNSVDANRLQNAAKEHMRRVTYRPRLRRKLTAEEVKQELASLELKAAEIIKPKEELKDIQRLERQLMEHDFTLYVEIPFEGQKERPFLEGIFYYKKAGTISAETAMRLAKLCIDKMLQCGHGQNAIVDTIDFMFMAHIITPEELSELINHLIPDAEKAAAKIKEILMLESDNEAPEVIVDDTDDGGVDIDVSSLADEGRPAEYSGPPVPPAFVDTRTTDLTGVRMPNSATGPFQEIPSAAIIDTRPLDDTPPAGTRLPAPSRISGYPELSRLIRSSRTALVIAGLLVVAGGTVIITSLGKRATDNANAGVATGIASTETGGEPELEPQIIDPARLAGEGEAAASAPTPAAPSPTPRPAAAPAPQTTANNLAGAPPLVAPTRAPAQAITIPVTIKPSAASGGFKIDTVTSRQQWEAMGYRVSVSMGLTGKIIRLTDSKGNVYQVAAENLAANTATLPATLRAAE